VWLFHSNETLEHVPLMLMEYFMLVAFLFGGRGLRKILQNVFANNAWSCATPKWLKRLARLFLPI